MNIAHVRICAERIEKYQLALEWLRNYGSEATTANGNADVVVRLHFGRSCLGAKEAEGLLEHLAKPTLADLVNAAVDHCLSEIRHDREAIRAELERSEEGATADPAPAQPQTQP